jgi:hypothetical protein
MANYSLKIKDKISTCISNSAFSHEEKSDDRPAEFCSYIPYDSVK